MRSAQAHDEKDTDADDFHAACASWTRRASSDEVERVVKMLESTTINRTAGATPRGTRQRRHALTIDKVHAA